MSPKVKAVLFFAGAVGCFLMVPIGMFNFWNMYRNNASTTEQPESYTVAALSQRGIGGNRHVRITDGQLGPRPAIYTTTYYNKTTRQTTTTTNAYYPIFSFDGQAPAIPLVGKQYVSNASGLPGNVLQGMVNNSKGLLWNTDGLDPLPSSVKEELERLYPGTKFSRCMAINLSETPTFERVGQLINIGIAVGFGIGGLVLFFLGRWNWRSAAPKEPDAGSGSDGG
jgi:hypothetical protein